jgi:hypothetical protein
MDGGATPLLVLVRIIHLMKKEPIYGKTYIQAVSEPRGFVAAIDAPVL